MKTNGQAMDPRKALPALRVLFAEDNPKDVKLVMRQLERSGYHPMFDVVDTIALFQKHLEERDYEVIISDYNLRDWTALDALEIFKKSGKEIPFLVVSGSLGDEAAVELIKRGATDYVLKDRTARLPTAICRALDGKKSCDERRQTEDALRKSEARYRNLVQNATYGIFLVGANGRFIEVNQAMVEMLGYGSAAEVLPLDMASAVCRDPENHQLFLEEAMKEGRFRGIKVGMKRKDGSLITVRLSGRAVHNEQDQLQGFEVIAEDITAHEQLEKQIHQLQKFEAIGQLAGGIAHDFNNHLGVILGYSEQLLERLEAASPLAKSATMIKEAAIRAASLTHQLLAFGRRQVLKPRVLDLNRVVSEYGKMLQPLLGEDIEVVTRLEPELAQVKADPSQLDQVIMNLAVNARDAMPQGGTLVIETANVKIDESYALRHGFVNPGQYVMLVVSDSGTGMGEETKRHLFEPFFTTKEKGKGTGLGLATVYGIIKQSGGYIWVYSEPGQGATFKIYLPRAEESSQPVAAGQALSPHWKGSETVLAVEDEAGLRKLLCEFLKEDGYTVLEASCGTEALEISRRYQGAIHLLMTDAVMPGISTRELVERLQEDRPDIKVLYVSGYTDDTILRRGLLNPATAFLQKPFAREALANKVREVLESPKEGNGQHVAAGALDSQASQARPEKSL